MERIRFSSVRTPEIPGIIPEIISSAKTQLSEEDKQRIFEPAIEGMRDLAQKHSIALPDNLLSRLYIVDEETYQKILREEKGEEEASSAGTALRNRLCILNKDNITRDSKIEGVSEEDFLR